MHSLFCAKITSSFSNGRIRSERSFFMRKENMNQKALRRFTAKSKDNVICYAFLEVI